VEWIRENTPFVGDLYFAKNDRGIRIVPTDDREAAPAEATPFANPGSARLFL
jgi:hypothetical protein